MVDLRTVTCDLYPALPVDDTKPLGDGPETHGHPDPEDPGGMPFYCAGRLTAHINLGA